MNLYWQNKSLFLPFEEIYDKNSTTRLIKILGSLYKFSNDIERDTANSNFYTSKRLCIIKAWCKRVVLR